MYIELIFCALSELDTKFHDKETVMRNGAERRIRGYLRLVCLHFVMA